MALNLDVSKLTQSAAVKPTAHDNCIVLDLGTGTFPRDIEVRLPDDDGARQNALWDGSLNLSVNDVVLCFEYSGISAWRIMAMGGNDGGAGQVRVSEVWESDFGAVALQADAAGDIGIGTTGPDAKLDILDTGGAQLRLTFEDGVKFADLTSDTNHHLTIDPSSTGQIKLNATVTVIDEIQHEGDTDTKLGFTDDDIEFTAGAISMLKLTEAAQDLITLGPGSGDVDIDFNGQMFLQGSDGFFGIGIAAPEQPLHIIGAASTVPQVRVGLTSAGYMGLYSTANNIGGTIAGASHNGTNFIARTTTPCFFTQVGTDGTVRIFTDSGKTVGVAFTPTERMRINSNGDVGIGIASPSTRLDIDAGAMEFAEMTAPGGGAANTCRIYADDNGAGKTRLMAIFNTGAAQQIAIQP